MAGLPLLLRLLTRNLNEKSVETISQRDRPDQSLTKPKVTRTPLVQSEGTVAPASGAAHKTQNPLNCVTNFAEMSLALVSKLEVEQEQATSAHACSSPSGRSGAGAGARPIARLREWPLRWVGIITLAS